jgi:hypothetical protein
MPLRLKFVMCLTLLSLLAVIFLSSCGYDVCADIPVLNSISPTSASSGGPTFTMTLTGRHFHSDTFSSSEEPSLPARPSMRRP